MYTCIFMRVSPSLYIYLTNPFECIYTHTLTHTPPPPLLDDSIGDLSESDPHHKTAPVRFRYDPRLMQPSPFYFTNEQVSGFTDAIEAPTLLVTAMEGWPAQAPEVMQARKNILGTRVCVCVCLSLSSSPTSRPS